MKRSRVSSVLAPPPPRPRRLVLSASSRAEIIERVVAKVNGDIVTQSEFEARQLAAVQAARIPPDQVETYLRENNQRILQEAVDDLLIMQRGGGARASGCARSTSRTSSRGSRRRTTSPTTRSCGASSAGRG